MSTTALELEQRFKRAWRRTEAGGLAARMARLPVAHLLLAQRLGIQVWGEAPLFFGELMRVLTGEVVSAGILAFTYSENALTALMLKALKPGDRFIDVGAHLGYEAMLGSRLVGPTGKVVTFEPQPRVACETRKNLSRFANVRLVEAAAGEAAGELQMDDLPLHRSAFAGTGGGSLRAPMVRLDDILEPAERPVSLLKVDVEGAEMSVLRGAIDILTKDRPLVVLEADMPQEDPARTRVTELTQFMAPLGYTAFLFDFDGDLRVGQNLKVHHANVLFCPGERTQATDGELQPLL